MTTWTSFYRRHRFGNNPEEFMALQRCTHISFSRAHSPSFLPHTHYRHMKVRLWLTWTTCHRFLVLSQVGIYLITGYYFRQVELWSCGREKSLPSGARPWGLKDFSLFGWISFSPPQYLVFYGQRSRYDVGLNGCHRNHDEYLTFHPVGLSCICAGRASYSAPKTWYKHLIENNTV